ncbi:hypothetical protein KCP69_00895 [Salmonella enterica subsp. enterica]|nr:hypothetical protein KCP69_00895 [Salmonella enterica subsp. enterica]
MMRAGLAVPASIRDTYSYRHPIMKTGANSGTMGILLEKRNMYIDRLLRSTPTEVCSARAAYFPRTWRVKSDYDDYLY